MAIVAQCLIAGVWEKLGHIEGFGTPFGKR
jgi:hypothetical protein